MIDLSEFIKEINEVNNEKKVIEIKNIFLKKNISPLYAELKDAVDKKTFGQKLNEIKNEIENITSERIELINAQHDLGNECNLNLYLEPNTYDIGNNHLLNTVIDDIANFLNNFNFALVSGDEVTSHVYNFDALNISKDHPARNLHDSFFIDTKRLLRTHCTATSAIFLEKHSKEKDIRVFSYGNVYRRDEDDPTHSHQFTQIDFVWVKKGLTLANLKYIINNLIKYIFGNELDVRYRLSYFPFTEPSFEVDVECWKCKGNGCNICKKSGWIEILGAGMLNQEVIKHAGIKEIETGIAAGIGVERIAMLKYGISDIRDFYSNDFEILEQFRK